jgi:ABC-type nitrate/sulfonate/bicarbonate transport system substrate-binding protein
MMIATTSPSQGATKKPKLTNVLIGCTPEIGTIIQDYMSDSGIAAQYGLNLQCVSVTTGPEQAALLVSGGLDISSLLPPNLYSLLDAGVPMVAFMPIETGPGFDLIIRAGFPLPDESQGWTGVMKDLANARIGVPALGAAGQDLAEGMFQEANVTGNPTYIATGAGSTTLAAMSANSIDAAITYEPAISEALLQGIAVQPFSLIEGGGPDNITNFGGLFYTTTRSYAKSHETLLSNFEKAYEVARAWMVNPNNHSKAIAFVEKDLGVNEALAVSVFDEALLTFTPATTVNANRYNTEGQFYETLGVATQYWPVSKYAVNVLQSTITCYKAKATKKVTAVKPTCPRGWSTKKQK